MSSQICETERNQNKDKANVTEYENTTPRECAFAFFFLAADTQLNQCPCRFFNSIRETQAPWPQNKSASNSKRVLWFFNSRRTYFYNDTRTEVKHSANNYELRCCCPVYCFLFWWDARTRRSPNSFSKNNYSQ